ncbi:MAG TPA: FecR domain-containing protein [Chitinophagaceae bacterium]|nr:FecR domain-containing protein [Chitinophagaceae bacterium]
MELGKMGIEDLLSDESFINYCKKTSSVDIASWESFKEKSLYNKELIESARVVFTELFNAMAVADMTEQENRLRNRLDVVEQAPVVQMPLYEDKKSKKRFSVWLKLTAAAILLLVTGYFIIDNYKVSSKKENLKSFVAANGERKNFQLPDGSIVTLNAGSKMTIDDSYGTATRDIFLEGEAFFDVKHNKELPFIVHTPAMDIKALGTSFNVKAYPCEKLTEASLVKGLVEVTLKEKNCKVLLHPNQKIEWVNSNNDKTIAAQEKVEKKISLDKLVQSLTKTDGGDVKEIAWIENKLVFNDEPLEDIAVSLERWYGVKIEFGDDIIRNYRFTGVYEKEELMTVLSFLKESKNFNYEIIPGDNPVFRLYK